MNFNYKGRTFTLTIEPDHGMQPPWKEWDGYGVVSDWERRNKRPCERILAENRGSKLFYDVQATMEKARLEGWGIGPEDKEALKGIIGREPTQKQVIAKAVDLDFQHLKRYCEGRWCYVFIKVEMEGMEHLEPKYLGGIEYSSECDEQSNLMYNATDLAEELTMEYQKLIDHDMWVSGDLMTVRLKSMPDTTIQKVFDEDGKVNIAALAENLALTLVKLQKLDD